MLRLAGVLNSDRNLYPIIDPNTIKYTKFHQYLYRFALSDNITQNNKIGLTLTANIVITDLAKKADIIFITPNIVLETYTHSISTINIVFYNKTKKVSKLGSFTKFI